MILWLCGNLMLLGAGIMFWARCKRLRKEWRAARRHTFRLQNEVDNEWTRVKLGLAEIERVRQEALRLSRQHGPYSREESYEWAGTLSRYVDWSKVGN